MEPPVGKQRKCILNRNKIIYAYALTKNRTRQKKFQRERGTKKIQTTGLLQGLNLFMFLSDEIMFFVPRSASFKEEQIRSVSAWPKS